MPVLATALATVLVLAVAAGAAIHFGLLDIGGQNTAVAQQAAPPPRNAAPAVPPQAPAPAQPQMTNRTTYEDWVYGCFETPDGSETRCSINQSLLDADTRNLVLLWRIIEDGQGGLAGIWQTPDAVLLRPGIRLDAGTPDPIVIPYEACGGGFCQASGTLAPEFIQTLSTADRITATIVAQNGRPVTLQFSVDGLAEGLAALRQSPPGAAQ